MSKIIWAKLDPGFYSNRKIIRAGRAGREVFQLALCLNAQRGAQGWIPCEDLEPWYVADQLRISEAEANDGLSRAFAAGLLVTDPGNADRVRIKGWGDDWARQKLTRAEIQANYRDRKEGKPERYQAQVTSDVTGNALPIREIREIRERDAVTDASRPDSLSGFESDSDGSGSGKSEQRAAKATSAARGAAQRPGQRALADWQPTQAAAAIAHELGLDHAHELAQFRLHAAANGRTYASPDAAFEKFLRGSRDAGKKPVKAKPGAYTTTPKRHRVQAEDGTLLEDDDHGGLRPVVAPQGRT